MAPAGILLSSESVMPSKLPRNSLPSSRVEYCEFGIWSRTLAESRGYLIVVLTAPSAAPAINSEALCCVNNPFLADATFNDDDVEVSCIDAILGRMESPPGDAFLASAIRGVPMNTTARDAAVVEKKDFLDTTGSWIIRLASWWSYRWLGFCFGSVRVLILERARQSLQQDSIVNMMP